MARHGEFVFVKRFPDGEHGARAGVWLRRHGLGGRGTRIYLPGDSNVMLFLEAGDPSSSSADKIHQ